jgi:pantetheine-phosphate adenylyltransferase
LKNRRPALKSKRGASQNDDAAAGGTRSVEAETAGGTRGRKPARPIRGPAPRDTKERGNFATAALRLFAATENHCRQRRFSHFRSGLKIMRHCIYPGTFDPITYGHLDVLSRAAKLFDRVTVAVAENAGKSPLFTSSQRVEMIAANLHNLPHVKVTTFRGLLVEFCMAQQADAIIRGLRALSDFEFEFNMALMNRHLEPQLETLFVMPNEQFSYTSSTLVKQVAKFGGDVQHFVPANVASALKKTFEANQPS